MRSQQNDPNELARLLKRCSTSLLPPPDGFNKQPRKYLHPRGKLKCQRCKGEFTEGSEQTCIKCLDELSEFHLEQEKKENEQ